MQALEKEKRNNLHGRGSAAPRARIAVREATVMSFMADTSDGRLSNGERKTSE